jgi:hypothetical protein
VNEHHVSINHAVCYSQRLQLTQTLDIGEIAQSFDYTRGKICKEYYCKYRNLFVSLSRHAKRVYFAAFFFRRIVVILKLYGIMLGHSGLTEVLNCLMIILMN